MTMNSPCVTKYIVILANSRKNTGSPEHDGRCIAGVEIGPTGELSRWVRPVSASPGSKGGEISKTERCYANRPALKSEPQLLDKVKMTFADHSAHGHQSENWTLDPTAKWAWYGSAHDLQLSDLVHPQGLWRGLDGSSKNFHNNRIKATAGGGIRDSLRLIRVDELTYAVCEDNNRSRVKAVFDHRGIRYQIPVTDPVVEEEVLAHHADTKVQRMLAGATCLTVSVGQEYYGYYYAFVAAALPARP